MNKKLISMLILSGFLAACGNETEPAQTVNTSPKSASATSVNEAASNPEWKTLMIATEANYPPFQYRDEAGKPIGFEVELMQEVAKAAQFNANIVHSERKLWRESLNLGNYDVWSSSFTISDKDAPIADFSDPFLQVENVIYLADTPQNANINKSTDLKGKKISISKYSKSAPQVVGDLTGSADLVFPSNTFYLALKDVYAGKTDGVFGQDLVLAYYNKQNTTNVKTKVINLGEKKKSLAFVVKKGNKEVLDKLNAGLQKVKENGVYDQLVKKYF